MLRIFFTHEDLAKMRVATTCDPFWEIVFSLHRLQGRPGRWAYAGWIRNVRARLADTGLDRIVRSMLGPLLPRKSYFPDFVTPAEAQHGFDAGAEAILAASERLVLDELAKLDRVHGTGTRLRRLADPDGRRELVSALRAYHAVAIKPVEELMQARVDADRAVRARALLDGGVEGLLRSLAPALRWKPPVLEAEYPGNLDIHLDGRGLRLVPSYFCWGQPVSMADPELPPVVAYPVVRDQESGSTRAEAPLSRLLGQSRALILRATAAGMTTGELARLAGVSPATASHHLSVLRDNGLVSTVRNANMTLHTLTPAGANLVRSARSMADAGFSSQV